MAHWNRKLLADFEFHHKSGFAREPGLTDNPDKTRLGLTNKIGRWGRACMEGDL